jgi:hypothetical protein
VDLALTAEQLRRRVWRVFNLLCAIPHGQRSPNAVPMIERDASHILLPALKRYRERLTSVGYPIKWDWNWTRVSAQKIQKALPERLDGLYKTLLQTRGNKARRWHGKPEFWHFMSILEEVMGIANEEGD